MDPEDRRHSPPSALDPPSSTLPPPPSTPLQPGRLAEVALLFTRLGFTAFGGPAVHTAMMEDEVVARRRWLDREHFLDLVGALNFIPGPNSTELAIHLGLIRAGLPGLVVAGVCFITPAVLVILPLAWLYVRYAGGPGGVRPPPTVEGAMLGVGAVVVAVLAVAAWRFAGSAFKDRFCLAVALLTPAADYLLRHHTAIQSEVAILAVAAAAGAARAGLPRPPGVTLPSLLAPAVPLSAGAAGWFGSGGPAGEFARLGWYFLAVGGTLFGSGYVLVNYLETGLVHQRHWLTPQQLADAVAVGQVTPGPLLTTATFVGYLRGHAVTGGSDWGGAAGAVVATAAIFLPAFVLVAVFGRVLSWLRRQPWARGALGTMNAAVAALLVLVTLRFAWHLQVDGRPDWVRIGLAITSLGLMLKWNVNATWLILFGAAAGVVWVIAGP